GPPTREGKAVRGLARTLRACSFAEVLGPNGVAVVLRERAVGDDEQLHVLEQPRPSPEAVALVTVDLVERLPDVDTPALDLDVDHREAVDQHRDVVPVRVGTGDLVLVDDLKPVV